ncbi:hypothetical protein K435DRAFT_974608 [Dendrothele bispora CBS 962.96]|uniref:Uncharacterized protein n=1 Tax=Dendrothele bispora (strain CBS 962.96) TaxID=1314807 RepID=A0A4S8KKH2_DENBC|nr:hypothetical protein K435DRAFT_974608 [Dendrothele bispora CBS 962.96]
MKSATHTTIAQRQWKPNRPKHDLLCINLSVVAELVLLLGSDAELCLCLKDLDIFLDAYANVEPDALVFRSKLAASLLPLFNKHAPHCNPVPTHAHTTCKSSDPCHFDCDSG